MPKTQKDNIILKIRKIFLEYTNHFLFILKKYPSAILLSQINSRNISESNSATEEEEDIEYTIGNYLIKNRIGQGNFGKVKLGIYIPNNEKVAVKILEKCRIKENNDEIRVKREFEMLSKFNHINVILVAEIFESKEAYYTVMEYCEGGELFDYIVKKRRLSEDESALFYFQLINGLEYIHSLGIVHRDLKPENLLLTKEKVLKIIDFGLSNYTSPMGGVLSTPCGSPCYASPEMVAGKKYDGFKIDIWSSGIILYAMLCGYLPFEDKNNENLFKKILKCNVDYPKYMSNEAKNLLNKILVNDPDKRINIEDIKKHPFFIRGKNLFDEEFNISKYSSRSISKNEHDFKISISNIDISNIDHSNEKKPEEKDKNNKENINGLNTDFLSLSNEKIYNTYNNNNNSYKECNSKSFTSINIQEKNIKKNLIKEKDVKNKNTNINSKKEKDVNLKKELKREKYKYKNIFDINKFKNKFTKKINSNIVNEYKFRNNLGNRKYLKTEIGKKKENLKKINYRNKTNSNLLNRKKNVYSKKLTDDAKLTSHKNKSIKFNEFNSYNRNIKSEIKNNINPIREYLKMKNNSLSKHNTNINSTINTNTVSLNNSKNKKQKGKTLLNQKIKKNYIIDIKGKKKKLNIISNKIIYKTNLKNYLKITPKVELKEKNKNGRSKNKNKNKNLQIKLDPKTNIIENSNNNYTITEIEEAKLKNNFKYLNTKNNLNKIKNLNEILRKNLYLTRNINKTIQENSYYRHTTNNSFKNIPFTTVRNNNNSKTFFHFKKIMNNPYLKKLYKKKEKDTITVKNTVINLNMVNSNLIISSSSKKNTKQNNSLNKKKILNTNINSNHQSQISQNISKNKIKEISSKKSNKLKLPTNLNLKYNLFRNLYRKNILNSSQNWARTESNEINVNKMKNKLDEIINKLKQNSFLQNTKHIKFNSMRLDELNKNKLKKITKTKTTVLSKPLSKKNNLNLLNNYLGNKTTSPKLKNIKKYNSHINSADETNSKNYSFQKLNKLSKNINNCKK